jgi:hypothetical protein
MLQKELGELRSKPDRVGPSHGELKVVEKLTKVLHQEEVMWRQRSRIQWLSEGDKNTGFFHLRTSQRKKKNRISQLIKDDGTRVTEEMAMGDMENNFYKNL